ncbi:MAG: hypothetical protein GTO60_16795 [Gammaproteobacteria bacterium]|nr:hypothetical protein [Gammaproteobacteria bacterium]
MEESRIRQLQYDVIELECKVRRLELMLESVITALHNGDDVLAYVVDNLPDSPLQQASLIFGSRYGEEEPPRE